MKPHALLALSLLLAATTGAHAGEAERPRNVAGNKVFHVVVVWLKRHGDANARRQYIEGSKRLATLPGVVSYDIGSIANIKREKHSPGVDDSYDVAVTSTFESQEALENYLKNPEHHKVVYEVLKPLVEKYKVYEFAE